MKKYANEYIEKLDSYLGKVIDESSKSLVGTIMKRFEIFENKDDVKKSIKELIYENSRSIKRLINAFSSGVKFISPKEQK